MGTPAAIQETQPNDFEIVPGDVIARTATTMSVLVRGRTIDMAYIDLGAATPNAGDRVITGRNLASWFTIGRQAGVGSNQVSNFSFEQDGAITGTPSQWFLSNIAGTGTPSVLETAYAPAGRYEASLFASAGVAQDTLLYSAPISVATGQTWALSAYTAAVYPSGAALTATGALYGLWFANQTNLYPTTSAADTLVQSATLSVGAPTHFPISGTVTVPAATTFMRVGLRAGSAAGVSVLFDAVIARRLT